MVGKNHKIPLDNLPFVLFMGPQRCGTSWLDRYLRARGDICMPKGVKEVFFFDRHYEKGEGFYFSHFKPESAHRLMMEVSTTAFDCPEAPARVKNVLGESVRLICPLRHPVQRSYSLYKHQMRYGHVRGSLREVCLQDPRILKSSQYAEHLRRWFEYFDPADIQFLFQEELEAHPIRYVHDVCTKLEVPYKEPQERFIPVYNASTQGRSRLLANTLQNGADFLRSNRLYGVVNMAKSMGLKKLAFGSDDNMNRTYHIPSDDMAWLEEKLYAEILSLEALIGDVPAWRSYGEDIALAAE